MPTQQVADAIFDAYARKATGRLTCSFEGKEARLWFKEGELVDVEGQFGIA
ncbi:MAG: hypothetical protein INH37_01485, partial [Myxococcaceae bacterium]|nr:hypothetical protein [Myxococcaceae bacterium]